MPQDLILRHVMTFVCMTALPLALCTAFAQALDTAPARHTTGSPKASLGDD